MVPKYGGLLAAMFFIWRLMTSPVRNPATWLNLAVVAALACLLLAATPAEARKYAAIVIDAESGEVVIAEHADAKRYPASLTKMMTLYMMFDALDRGQFKLSSKLKVSSRAAGMPPSKLGLRAGQTISVKDAILALVTKSANDVAVVVAEALGGTESRFARMMTKRARQLGMKRTTFRNASGLPNSGQKSTARDMARLGRALIYDHPRYFNFFATRSFTFRGVRYGNHNKLLAKYKGTDGIKTGYINASGFNLVASVTRNGRRLIGVVFGGRTGASRNRHMIKLLDRGFAALGPKRQRDSTETMRISGLPKGPLERPTPKPAGATSNPVLAAMLASPPPPDADPIPSPERKPGMELQMASLRGTVKADSAGSDTIAGSSGDAGNAPDFGVVVARAPSSAPIPGSKTGSAASASRAIMPVPERHPTRGETVAMGDADVEGVVERGSAPAQTLTGIPAVAPIETPVAAIVDPLFARVPPEKPLARSERWSVQVGAFRKMELAREEALRAKSLAPAALAHTNPVVVQTQVGDDVYFRARLTGLKEDEAEKACEVLKRKRLNCLPVGPKGRIKVALSTG